MDQAPHPRRRQRELDVLSRPYILASDNQLATITVGQEVPFITRSQLTDQGQIRGLTTAASIWTTAAVGIAAGLGRFALATLAAILAVITLSVLNIAENNHSDNA